VGTAHHPPSIVVTLGSPNAALAQSAAPKNLRVTGVTDWTVTLKWDAPKGKAPSSYVVQCSNGHSTAVAGSQTTATFSSGFDYNRTYSFRVYAVSSSGAWSSASNSVTATLLSDTTPAAKPVVSSTGNGPTHVDLAWSYGDSDPSPRFDIYVNGQLWYGQVASRVDDFARRRRNFGRGESLHTQTAYSSFPSSFTYDRPSPPSLHRHSSDELTSRPNPECAGPQTAPWRLAHRNVLKPRVGQCYTLRVDTAGRRPCGTSFRLLRCWLRFEPG
jgi:hypothetical protein